MLSNISILYLIEREINYGSIMFSFLTCPLSFSLSVASLPDAEQQLLCERCCHGSRETSAAHQRLAPHILLTSHLWLTDISVAH